MLLLLRGLQLPSSVSVKADLKGFDRLIKNIKTDLVVQIGIFANKNARKDESTNADIGARHEFGVISEGLPRRSFLEDPLKIKRKEFLKQVSKIVKANIDKKNGDKQSLKLIGIAAEAIIQEAFETGGFGAWEALSPETIAAKASATILIDRSELRRAISSKVKKIK